MLVVYFHMHFLFLPLKRIGNKTGSLYDVIVNSIRAVFEKSRINQVHVVKLAVCKWLGDRRYLLSIICFIISLPKPTNQDLCIKLIQERFTNVVNFPQTHSRKACKCGQSSS